MMLKIFYLFECNLLLHNCAKTVRNMASYKTIVEVLDVNLLSEDYNDGRNRVRNSLSFL